MLTLTEDQKKILAKQARSELSRRSFVDYVAHVHHGLFTHFKHTRYLCEQLQPIADGEKRKILIELPPRHGKSMAVTESFPSYFIGRNPDKRVITAAYGDSLARRFGRMNKQKIDEFGAEIFDIQIAWDASKAGNWSLEGHRGGMLATGIGGAITGEGADLLIVDDPFKNREAANSPTIRNKVWDEWQSTLLTRLQKNASIIVIMTRWHEDDLIGRILQWENADEWQRIRIPAIAEDENDLLGREIGEPLCPELGFDEKWAKEKKIEVGSMVWAALYQQRPSPPSGAVIKRKWFEYYKQIPSNMDELIQSWDFTFKDTKDSDYVVGQVWGRRGGEYYLLDQVRDQMDFPTSIAAIKSLSAKWPEARAKLVEDKANGSAVISTLRGEVSGLVPVQPKGSKVERAYAVTPLMEAGNVFLPHPTIAPWIHDYVEECASFPLGANDDQVDTTTQALDRLSSRFRKKKGKVKASTV
ncbi:phage terminase large subunit [Halalkalibacterium halodurans]|uniref:phage terminase large subunit n=1 Tax=Halalkalibacterium halodurans TaxID=86665 RepID=UPI002E2194DF|nr:phage terminase large subunit [Halalkalibacterium halodurans]